jgi:hypothetical protein
VRKNRVIHYVGMWGVAAFLTILAISISGAEDLLTLSLDDTSVLGTTVSSDKTTKTEGMGSVRISTVWPTTISLGEVTALEIENATLVYQAKVKSDNLEGQAFLEMWCHVAGGQYFSRGLDSKISGSSSWKILETPFLLQAGQSPDKITLNIVINGRGTVWVDDIRLIKRPLK